MGGGFKYFWVREFLVWIILEVVAFLWVIQRAY